MDILIVLISLLIVGILAHYCGKLAEYFGQDRVKVVEKAIEKM